MSQRRRRLGDGGIEPFRHASHPRPVTRRQFLAQGFLSGAAMVMAPSLLGFFPRSMRAQVLDCGLGGGINGRIPFVVFDLAGGANTTGSNVLVGGVGGQLDLLSADGYARLGLPPTFTPIADPANVNTELGLAFQTDSAFLRGIQLRTSPTTRANVNGAVFCARSDNDTGNNPHNPMYGIYKAGADGQLVTLIGTQASDSGGNSQAPMAMIDPTVRPTKVDRPQDATGLVDTGKLVELLPNPADAAAVMTAAQNLSDRKVERMNETQVVSELIQCAFRESTELVANFGNPASLDPRLDPVIAAAAGSIFTATELNNQGDFRKTASVMKLVVNGFAGAGTIELGGYDYHDGTRASGERKDFIAGQAIGAVLEYAARRLDVNGNPDPTPVAIYVLSDGSLDSDGTVDGSADGRDKFGWRGDNSQTAGTFMLVYDPLTRPTMGPAGNQVGYFRDSGNVETAANRIADEVTLLTQAIVLNYLAMHGQAGQLNSVLPGHGLGSGGQLDPLIAFSTLPSLI
jgi:hypothetical protein